MCESNCNSNSKSPKSQLSQQMRHKELYKTSPNWQQLYREQCLTRLNDKRHETRSRLIEKFRNIDIKDTTSDEDFDQNRERIIEEVMKSVWDQYRQSKIPEISQLNQSDITDFMEQIRQELIIEEGQYWEDLLEWRKEEELEWLLTNRDSVVCFFCKKNPLKLKSVDSQTELICNNCEFHFTAQSPLTLRLIQERIDYICAQHNSVCTNRDLIFNLVNNCSTNNSNNISLSCPICGKIKSIF